MIKVIFNKAIIILLALIPMTTLADIYFVDNENGDNSNDGTSWSQAFKSIDILVSKGNNIDDVFYIKATDTPYRYTPSDNLWVNRGLVRTGVFYFDATGNLNNIYERSSKRAKYYGSRQVPGSEWYLLNPSSSEKLYRVTSPYSSVDEIGRAYIDGQIPVRINEATSIGQIQNNEYYLDKSSNKIYYRNDNQDPATLAIEWVPANILAIEGVGNMSIFGLSIKYFGIGLSNGGCLVDEVSGLDISYNHGHGIVIASNKPGGAIYSNIESHHNGGDGIHVQGFNNTKVFNCVSHNNEGDGITLVPASVVGSTLAEAVVAHCTSFKNSGSGFKIYTQASWLDIYNGSQQADDRIRRTLWDNYNNISASNGQMEFVLVDDNVPPNSMFNAWYGQNNTLYNQYSGFANMENVVPNFVDITNNNYHLRQDSLYRGKGIYLNFVTSDIDDEARSSYPDIGADEFK